MTPTTAPERHCADHNHQSKPAAQNDDNSDAAAYLTEWQLPG